MIPKRPFQKLGVVSFALYAMFLLAHIKCDAAPTQQQSQSQQTPPPPPPPSSQSASDPPPVLDQLPLKRRKVWTNDDVLVLRSPTDDYLAEKEAKEAADAKATAKEAALKTTAKSGKEPPLEINLPDTREETEKMVKDTQAGILEETDILAKLQKELLDAPAEQQDQKQKEIDRLTVVLETSHRNLKALREHLQTFSEKPPEPNSTASPQPPAL
jgi:hypothetical protein